MTKSEAKKRAMKAVAEMAYQASKSTDIFDDGKTSDDDITLLRWKLREVAAELFAKAARQSPIELPMNE